MITHLCSGVGNDPVRVDRSGDGKSIKRFRVLDGVTSGEGAMGFRDFIGASSQDLVDGIEIKLVGWHCDDVHGRDGLPSHGVNIGEGVGGCDLPEEIRVVDDRSEEIECLNQGQVFADAVYGSVVRAGGSNEKIRV
ncbi:MAG: hypothetical protein ACJAT6_001429 [Akkermansiaceae bacterium]|jgi:hypothetical protein